MPAKKPTKSSGSTQQYAKLLAETNESLTNLEEQFADLRAKYNKLIARAIKEADDVKISRILKQIK